jgi:M6 family metalloprotease-like protein
MMGIPMTTKYVQLLFKSRNPGYLALACILGFAIAFAGRAQAIESDLTPDGKEIAASPPACSTTKPGLSLSPGSRNAGADTNPAYTIRVTNQDDNACGASIFDLTVTYLPEGWTGDLSVTSLNLEPGATGTSTLTVNPADNPETDSNKLQVSVSDAQKPIHTRTSIAKLENRGPATGVANVRALPVPGEPETVESGNPVKQVADAEVSIPVSPSGRVERNSQTDDATLEGKLQVVSIGLSHAERTELVAETPSGKLIPLKTNPARKQRLTRLPSGTLIEFAGKLSESDFEVTGFSVLGADGGVITTGDPGTGHYSPAIGERRVAVLLVNFLDNASEPGTPEQARAVFDDKIRDFFAEASFNQASMITDVYGWWTLPFDTSRCSDPDQHLVSSEILQAAANRGVDLDPYDHLVFVFNDTFGVWCSNGAGTVSPNSQGKVWRTWNNGAGVAESAFDGPKGIQATIHELGHNLGLWHANRLDCTLGPLDGDCTTVGYGDFYDTMGAGSATSHFNAFHKERLGWISPDDTSTNHIYTVAHSGIYTLSPYAADGGTKALRIRRGPNADGGVDYFYLDYRQPVGWDAGLGQKAFEGILVHLGNDTTADSSRLLDMDFADSWREALLPGMSFHDRASDVTISLLSADSAEAIMEITVGDDITPPTTSIGTPVEGDTLAKGTETTIVAYAVDDTAMGQVDFYVGGVLECSVSAGATDDYTCPYKVPKGKSRMLMIEVRAIDTSGNVASATIRVSTGDGGTNRGSGGGGKGKNK